MYAGANGRSKPFSDGKVVRGFHTSEQIFAAKRRSEKSGCPSGDTDKPIATPGPWHYHTVKIDRLEGLEQFCGIMEELMLYTEQRTAKIRMICFVIFK